MNFSKIAILSTLIFLSGCSNPFAAQPPETTQKPLPEVQTEMTKRTIVQPTLSISGTVSAQEEITIASEVNGTVSRVFKKEGDTVKTGEIIMQLGSGDNMLSISFASAQRSLQNAAKLLELTRQAGLKQVKTAEIAAERAELNLKKLENTKKLNAESQKAQTENVKSSVAIAETGLSLAKKTAEDAIANEEKTHINLLASTANGMSNALVPMNASLHFVDTIFGISNTQKTNNDDFEVFIFGNVPYDTKQKTIERWSTIFPQLQELKAQLSNINKKKYTKDDEPNIQESLAATLGMLKETRTILQNSDEILQYSFVTPQFSQAKLDGFKSQIQGYLQSIEGSIASITAQEQALQNFALQSPQRILDAQLNISIAEGKVIAAQSSLIAAESEEASVDITVDASISEAKNALAAAKANVEMAKIQAGVSNQNSIVAVSSAQSSVDSSAFSLSKLSISSRIGGTVTKIFKKDGDTLQAGTPLVVISNVSALQLVSDVSVEERLMLTTGMPAKISITGVSQEFTGVLSLIYPEADKVTRRVKIEILIPNAKKIPANTFATAKLQLKASSPAIYIPLTSLISQNPPAVMTVETGVDGKNILKKVPVELGKQNGETVEITKGLRPNQMLVTQNYSTLFEGDEVLPMLSAQDTQPKQEEENKTPPNTSLSSLEADRKTNTLETNEEDPMKQLWDTKKSL